MYFYTKNKNQPRSLEDIEFEKKYGNDKEKVINDLIMIIQRINNVKRTVNFEVLIANCSEDGNYYDRYCISELKNKLIRAKVDEIKLYKEISFIKK